MLYSYTFLVTPTLEYCNLLVRKYAEKLLEDCQRKGRKLPVLWRKAEEAEDIQVHV